MHDSLIVTKFHVPPAPPSCLLRERLFRRLTEGLYDAGQFRRRLTLVTGPAGYGKTTLAASWIEGLVQAGDWQLANSKPRLADRVTVIWLSLDEGDDPPGRFFRYLFGALQGADDAMQERVAHLAYAAPLPPVEDLARDMVNSVAAAAKPFVLVLDDYQHVTGGAADEALAFLLRHQPSNLHLLLTSRSTPSGLPLARLRSRQQILTLDQRDLRFTTTESKRFLQTRLGRQLKPEDAETIVRRAAGWVGALQLSALALQQVRRENRQDVASALEASSQYLSKYLADEVLATLPAASQSFLLQTSILKRLCAPLCRALLEPGSEISRSCRAGGNTPEPGPQLEDLAKQGYFLTRLDGEGKWYRTHALFQSFLRRRLQRLQPDVVPQLHRRAAEWHRAYGSADEAVHHALATNDTDYALAVVASYVPWLLKRGSLTTLLTWLKPLKKEHLRSRPSLGLDLAWAYLSQSQLERAEALIIDLEPYQAQSQRRDTLAIRLAIARRRGDIDAARAYAKQASMLQAPDEDLQGSVLGLFQAELHLSRGEPATARRLITQALRSFRVEGQPYMETQALYYLSNVHIVRGQLKEAEVLCLEALDIMDRYRLPYRLGGFHNRLGLIHWEWGKLQRAAEYLQEGTSIARKSEQVRFFVRNALLLAKVWRDQGQPEKVDALLEEARRRAASLPQALAQLTTWQAWSALQQGQPTAAAQWIRARGLRADDEPDYFTMDGYLLLARLLHLRQENTQARRLLRRLRALAGNVGDTGANIAVLLELAQLTLDEGEHRRAKLLIEEALIIGSPGGYVQRFVNTGAQLKPLLGTIGSLSTPGAATRFSAAYLQDVLSACGLDSAPHGRAATFNLGEPLTARERDVSGLLAQGMSNPQIAEQLHISVGTVRWHLKNVYRKLDVTNRVEATLRLQALSKD